MVAKQAVAVGVIKSIIFLFMLLGWVTLSAQKPPKKKAPPSIDVLYSYYQQDGDNGAVRGGIGSQALTYHAPAIIVHIPADSVSQWDIKAGVDIYTSASTDDIDFNVSSASRKDARTYISIGYQEQNENKESSFGVHGSASVESDYLSFGIGGFYTRGFYNYNTVLSAGVQLYFDDCRWGWLSTTEGRELHLIYPVELRFKEWETQYKRYTSTLSLSLSQLISKKVNIGIFTDIAWQTGLLSTTFHRIFFQDSEERVIEKLPYDRWKLPLGFRVNYFATPKLLFRGYYRYYTDSWGLNAHSIEIESSIKFNAFFSVFPFYRYHVQNAVFWFNPYAQHRSSQAFYTSDYDLSAFTAHKFGIGFFWKPIGGIARFNGKGYGWKQVQIRLGTYLRSDGLEAYYISSIFSLGQ
jgi:hypothetical protein